MTRAQEFTINMVEFQQELDALQQERDAAIDEYVSQDPNNPGLAANFEEDMSGLQEEVHRVTDEMIKSIQAHGESSGNIPHLQEEDCEIVSKYVTNFNPEKIESCKQLVRTKNAEIDQVSR